MTHRVRCITNRSSGWDLEIRDADAPWRLAGAKTGMGHRVPMHPGGLGWAAEGH